MLSLSLALFPNIGVRMRNICVYDKTDGGISNMCYDKEGQI